MRLGIQNRRNLKPDHSLSGQGKFDLCAASTSCILPVRPSASRLSEMKAFDTRARMRECGNAGYSHSGGDSSLICVIRVGTLGNKRDF